MAGSFKPIAYLGVLLLAGCIAADPAGRHKADASPTPVLDRNTLVRIADRMREQGDLPMAAEFYQHAIAEDESNVAAYYGLATLQTAVGAHEEAGRAYREALRYDAGNPDILRDYAKSLLSRAQYGAAILQYRNALAERPHDGKALNGLGVALDQLGEHAEAQKQYRAALAQDPDDMTALNNLGMSLIMAGDYAAAISALAPAAESFKATESLRRNLALAYARAGANAQPLSPDAAPDNAPYTPAPAASPVAPVRASPLGAAPAPAETGRSAAARAVATSLTATLPPAPAPVTIAGIFIDHPLMTPIPPTRAAHAPPPALSLPTAEEPPLPASAAIILPEPEFTHTITAQPAPQPVQAALALPAIKEPPSAGTETLLEPVRLAALPPALPPAPPVAAPPGAPGPLAARPESPAAIVATPAIHAPAPALPREQRTTFGPYATDIMAHAQQIALQNKLSEAMPRKAVLNIVTHLTGAGTPEFLIHLYGFENQNELAGFCRQARAAGFDCTQG